MTSSSFSSQPLFPGLPFLISVYCLDIGIPCLLNTRRQVVSAEDMELDRNRSWARSFLLQEDSSIVSLAAPDSARALSIINIATGQSYFRSSALIRRSTCLSPELTADKAQRFRPMMAAIIFTCQHVRCLDSPTTLRFFRRRNHGLLATTREQSLLVPPP